MLTLATHSVDETLIPPNPTILDVGCRDFDFSRAVLERWPGATIVALDPDPIIADPAIPGVTFVNKALTGLPRPAPVGYASYSTGHGNFLTEGPYYDARIIQVSCITLPDLMRQVGLSHWDVIKLDCEGSEFEVLENFPGPVTSQISVEFHDYTDLQRWNNAFYQRLFTEKMPWYQVRQHALTPVGGGAHLGHWDSVLILKPA